MSDGHPFPDDLGFDDIELANDNDPPWRVLAHETLYHAFNVDTTRGDVVPPSELVDMILPGFNLPRKRIKEIYEWWKLWGTLPEPIVLQLEHMAASFTESPGKKIQLTVVEGGP